MNESKEGSKTYFAGVYFDRDSVLRVARLAEIFSWIALIYYVGQTAVALTILILQLVRGLIVFPGLTDYIQQTFWTLQPIIPGLWNFIGLQAVGKFLLIIMDLEDNTRRTARNK
jgi:hypothetical protein